MKTKQYTFALLVLVCAVAQAQVFSAPMPDNNAIQSQQIYSSGSSYNGTIYEPFGTSVPSEQSEVGASYSPAKAPGRPRRTETQDGRDAGDATTGSDLSPIGDALLPLMLIAAAYSTLFLRRRKEE